MGHGRVGLRTRAATWQEVEPSNKRARTLGAVSQSSSFSIPRQNINAPMYYPFNTLYFSCVSSLSWLKNFQ